MGSDVFEILGRCGVVPVIAIESEDHAIPLADALLEGGLPIVEITFRTKAAAGAIRQIAVQRPQVLVGAGTVLTLENLDAARSCGAKFAVAPGLNPTIVNQAKKVGLPFVPGVATPSELEIALELGCHVLKFFPAEALGGLAMLKALIAPYGHMGVRFMPTGGINPDNLADYLAISQVAAVGGTWIAKKEDMIQGRWDEIRSRCAKAVEAVANARGKSEAIRSITLRVHGKCSARSSLLLVR
jgi:2-dehydro-3-deoxyphosphogluconate aldolase/(4S)-4-hydroxy-2-oxoglutarate aldolase